MEVVLLSIAIIAISFLALGFNIFFRKDGKFPENEVGKNRNMKAMGIYCTKCEEHRKYREYKKKLSSKIEPLALKLDVENL